MKDRIPLALLVSPEAIKVYRRHTGATNTDGKIASTLLRFWRQSKPCMSRKYRQYGLWKMWSQYGIIERVHKVKL